MIPIERADFLLQLGEFFFKVLDTEALDELGKLFAFLAVGDEGVDDHLEGFWRTLGGNSSFDPGADLRATVRQGTIRTRGPGRRGL